MGASSVKSPGIETIDVKAKQKYKNKIIELKEEIEEADQFNQIERAKNLREELNSIIDHLSKSLTINGEARKIGASIEKARSAVTWRIRNIIKKLKTLHPKLEKHLSRNIYTGTFCSYRPEIDTFWKS